MANRYERVFDRSYLFQLKDINDMKTAKKYIKQYFFKVEDPLCIFYYNGQKKQFVQIDFNDFKNGYVTTEVIFYVLHEDKKPKVIKLQDWFLKQDTDYYQLKFNPQNPLIYDEGDSKYLNLFKGFKYANEDKPEFTPEMMDSINFIWQHVKEAMCGNDEECYQYAKKWIAHMVNGRKMKTALYIKGTQGAGKSSIPLFIQHVIGDHNGHLTPSNSCLGKFNSELQGIILLILDELKCTSPQEWKVMNSSLNVLITSDTIDIEPKGQQCFNIQNHISVIITANSSAIQINKKDRRYFMTDVSPCKEGDFQYFDRLYSLIDDKLVQKAFYFYCKEYAAQTPFNESVELSKIETSAKTEVILKHLHPIYLFIKENWVLKKKHFNIFLKDLAQMYNEEKKSNKPTLTSIEISRLLKEVGIEGKPSTGNLYRYVKTNDELFNIYKKNKWIHEMDEFNTEYELPDDSINNELMEKIKALQSENELLKKGKEEALTRCAVLENQVTQLNSQILCLSSAQLFNGKMLDHSRQMNTIDKMYEECSQNFEKYEMEIHDRDASQRNELEYIEIDDIEDEILSFRKNLFKKQQKTIMIKKKVPVKKNEHNMIVNDKKDLKKIKSLF
jgi:hypothetical protein